MIDQFAFSGNNLTSVVIPDSVTRIDRGAFQNNQLETIVISEYVTTIKSDAYLNNPITSITIHGDETRFNEDWDDIGFPGSLMPDES